MKQDVGAIERDGKVLQVNEDAVIYIVQIEKELARSQEKLRYLKNRVDELKILYDATPPDCKRGSWCEACAFAKKASASFGLSSHDIYFCGKGEVCPNFIQRKV